MSFDSNNLISWSRFEECNSNTTTAFEGMCRALFKKHFLDEHDVIHSNPNNPGVEILPVKQKETGKRISFQAKYFTTMDYDQIKQSAEMTIKHYSNQIDVVYLYCNKDVTTTSKSYTAIKELLGRNNIEIISITNNTILDQVLSNQVIPCKELISCLSLEQKGYDGYFYDENGTLVVFDGNLANIEDGLFIRKEHLDKFLYENGLKLFWICFGEKQFFTTDFVPASSEWGGFLYLDGDRIGGDFENKEGQPYIE